MSPTLRPGQLVIFVSSSGSPRANDIVLLRHNGLEKVKRVCELRPGEIFVVGDNSAASADSRAFGWLPDTVLQAKLIWPRQRRE